jgi:molybdopterin-binding protein
VTTLFVTHDREEAMQLADRVAVVLGGRLRQVGATDEVFGAPADEEVAAFVEVENILPGQVTAAADGLVEVRVGNHLVAAVADLAVADAVRVCLRPEDVVLELRSEGGGLGSAQNHLTGVVSEVTSLGSRARVVVDCGFRLVATITSRSLEDLELSAGRPVTATFKATAVHLLPVSEERTP